MTNALTRLLKVALTPKRSLQHKALKEGLLLNYLMESHFQNFPKIVRVDDEMRTGATTYRVRVVPAQYRFSVAKGHQQIGVLTYNYITEQFDEVMLPGTSSLRKETNALYEAVMDLHELDEAARSGPRRSDMRLTVALSA